MWRGYDNRDIAFGIIMLDSDYIMSWIAFVKGFPTSPAWFYMSPTLSLRLKRFVFSLKRRWFSVMTEFGEALFPVQPIFLVPDPGSYFSLGRSPRSPALVLTQKHKIEWGQYILSIRKCIDENKMWIKQDYNDLIWYLKRLTCNFLNLTYYSNFILFGIS